jgi:hypothetical protein
MKTAVIFTFLLFCNCAIMFSGYKFSDLAKVKVYSSPPQCRYQEIGSIAGSDEDYSDLIEKLQLRALKNGGNALILQQQGQNTIGKSGVGGSNNMVIGGGSSEEKIYLLATIILIQ